VNSFTLGYQIDQKQAWAEQQLQFARREKLVAEERQMKQLISRERNQSSSGNMNVITGSPSSPDPDTAFSVTSRIPSGPLLAVASALARKALASKTASPFVGCNLAVWTREGAAIGPVAGFADRVELTDETRLAGRPWARAGMSLALISHLREAAHPLQNYTLQEIGDMTSFG